MATAVMMKQMTVRYGGAATMSQQRQARSISTMRSAVPTGRNILTQRQMSTRFEALRSGFSNKSFGLRGSERQVKMHAAAEEYSSVLFLIYLPLSIPEEGYFYLYKSSHLSLPRPLTRIPRSST